MLKEKTGKLEPIIELCMFVGYPKGTMGGLFYSLQEKKVFVLTNATFLKTNYMTNYKTCSKVVLEEFFSNQIRSQSTIVVERQSEETTSLNQENLPP